MRLIFRKANWEPIRLRLTVIIDRTHEAEKAWLETITMHNLIGATGVVTMAGLR